LALSTPLMPGGNGTAVEHHGLWPLYVILAAFNGWLPLRRAGRSQLARPEAAA
jgi:hypothetical protein